MHWLQLEQCMSYNATCFEYMNTYADIMYAYGASAAIRHVWDHRQTGSCKSVVCETKIVLCDIILWEKKPVQKDTETTLFTTETAQQKQHTTQNYSTYSSVAISAHCCLHWCSHRTSIPQFCFVHVEFDIARLLLLWSVLLLHHAGSRSHPGWGEGIYGRIGYSKAGIAFEGCSWPLEEFLTASSCTNSEYQR